MDGAELATTPTPALNHPSRPTLGFPLGTALLLIVIFCLSGIFSCCYHWEKLRSLRDRSRRRHGNQPSLAAVEDGQLPQFSLSSPASKVALQHQVPITTRFIGNCHTSFLFLILSSLLDFCFFNVCYF